MTFQFGTNQDTISIVKVFMPITLPKLSFHVHEIFDCHVRFRSFKV